MDDFAELVEEHQHLVFRTLARLLGGGNSVEDLAQEVFLRLSRALPHFERRAKITTYLYRIIVNVVNDEFRRRQRARRNVSVNGRAAAWIDPSSDPAQLLERKRLRQALEASLGRLSVADRTILTLHYQEHRKYEEIAEILSLPIGTVKTNLFRARQRLRADMKEWVTRCRTNA